MNRKLVASVAVLAMLVMAAVPAVVTDADVEPSDYSITVSGANPDGKVVVKMNNGESRTWTVYIVNTSDRYLDVSFSKGHETDDIKFTDMPSNVLLGPEYSDYKHIASVNITIETSVYSDNVSKMDLSVLVLLTDVETKEIRAESILFYVSVDSIYDSDDQYNKFFGVIPNTLPAPLNSAWVAMIVTILVYLAITWVICRIAIPPFVKWASRGFEGLEKDKKLGKNFIRLVVLQILVLAINQGLSIIGADPTVIKNVISVSTVLTIIIITVALWLVYRLIIIRTLDRMDGEDGYGDRTLVPLFTLIGKLLFWVIGASAVMSSMGIDLQAILVSAGVITLGITLGAQNVLSQFFSGLVILISKPFRLGDFLKINGNIYVVNDVKLMYTEFKSWDGDQIITMPNNAVTNATIINLTKEDTSYMLYTYYSVAYDTDVEKVKKILLDVADKNKFVLRDDGHARCSVKFSEMKDSGMEFRLGTWIADFNSSSAAAGSLNEDVFAAFHENGIEIPYNRLEVDVIGDVKASEKE